ncbi:MAG: AMP-binding protein [Nevskia sp.]|nr:AMP-binding protein [Nevskia sp.]
MMQRTLIDTLLDWESRAPDRPWLFQPVEGAGRTFTFAQAADQVRRMAAAIRAMGLAPGSRIAISGRNTAHWILADLAIAMAGHVAVGLYPRQGQATLGYIVEHAEIDTIFVGPSLMAGDADELVASLPKGLRRIGLPYPGTPATELHWDELVVAHQPLHDAPQVEDGATAMLIYTSGTSGKPKGVMLSHANLRFAVDNILRHTMTPLPREVLFSYLPLAHLMERLFGEVFGLVIGAEMHFLERPEELAATLARVAPTRFSGVPLVYSRIQGGILGRIPQRKLDRMLRIPLFNTWFKRTLRRKMGLQNVESLGVGAAAMPAAQVEWFRRLGLDLYQGYGMTENCAYAALELPGASRPGSVGKPLPESGFRIASDGEIQFRHGAVMAGYFKDEEKTREAFTSDGWLRTGDRGHLDEDGFLYVTGRIKDEFKTAKGKYVVPAPVENRLARNTDLEQLCLVGSGLNQPIMLATLSANGKLRPQRDLELQLAADIREVNAEVEADARIAKCVIVDEAWTPDNGLVTPTGKVKRAEVEDHYRELIAYEARTREPVVCWGRDFVGPVRYGGRADPLVQNLAKLG